MRTILLFISSAILAFGAEQVQLFNGKDGSVATFKLSE
jgi:hypothetical protein